MELNKTPHNDFFYQVMSRKDKARAFFERYLPKSILEIADPSQLELVESKHISDAGIALYNDVLYRCPLGNNQTGYFFAVCEHQSSPYAQMPLRLLKYDTAAIEAHLKQGYDKFPVVINIVLYHGKSPWPYSTAFVNYYADPQLGAQYLYMAPFTLVNLPSMPAEAIYQDQALGFCFGAFQCTSSADPYQAFARMLQAPIFRDHFEKLPFEERQLVVRYLGNCIDQERYSLEKLVDLVIINSQEKEEAMTSIAQAYKQEALKEGLEQGLEQGIQRGMQQGIQCKAREIAKNMLASGLDVDLIIQVTGLNLEDIKQLQKR